MKNHYNFPKLSFLKIFIICFLTISFNLAQSANYYWVGGTGNWSEFATHWATTSGGAVFYATVPGPADDVFFDANSFTMASDTVTIDVAATCKSMDWTGATGTPDFAGFNNLEIYGSVTFIPAMKAHYSGWLYFKSDSAGNILNFSTDSIFFGGIEFNGKGDWTLMSDMDISNAGLQVSKGTVNTNGYTVSVGWFDSWTMENRTIIFGNSTINIVWNLMLMNPSTLTLDAGTSTINIRSTWFDGKGLTYYDVNFPLAWLGDIQIQGANTFHTIGLNDTNVTGVIFDAGKVNTLYDINLGATCSNRKTIKSWNDGEAAIIKKITGTVQEDYLNIKDITIIGGANFITDNGIDMGNVTNWTINTSVPTDYYWVGGQGNWSDTDHWGTSTGAPYPTGNTCVPTDVDNVFFDANSFSVPGDSVIIDVYAFCNSMDWFGVTNVPELVSSWPSELNIYGSLTFVPGMTVSCNSAFHFKSANPGNTITMAGQILNSNVYFEGSGDWTLQDNLDCSSIYLNQGYLNTNNNNIDGSQFMSNIGLTRQLDLGSSVITLTSIWWIQDSADMTLNTGTSTINTGGWSFYGGGFTYNDVTFTSTNYTYIYNSNIFNVLTLNGGGDLILEQGQTQVLNDLIASGDCSDLLDIKSTSAGSIATISKSAGTINVDYVTVQDITATGGATFNANNSIDNGNNSGWNFTALSSNDYYWISGAGDWSDATHWSLASGGGANPGGCIPTQVDNVIFDANSFSGSQTMTIDINADCNNMDWSAAPGNANMNGTKALNIYGSFDISGITNYWFNGNLYLKSDNIGNIINTGGKTLNNHIYFNGSGEWTLSNNFTTDVSHWKDISLIKGSLKTNNFNITTDGFYSSSEENRQLTLGSSTITVNSWLFNNGTNLTVFPGTSTIDVANGYYHGGNQSYNDVNINSGGAVNIYGTNSFNNLNIPTASRVGFEGGSTNTFIILTIPFGTDCNDYFDIGTFSSGAVANILMPAGVFNGDWLVITDLTAGGGATFNATNSIGIGDVTGWNITSPAPVNLYWIGDGGDWNDPLHWSLTSGGASYGCIPTSEDSVFFDANSFSLTGQIVNVNVKAYCKNMDWTGVTNTPELTGNMQININGSLILVPGINMTYSGTFNFISSGTGNTVTSSGLGLASISFSGSGDYTLLNDLSFSSWYGITFNSGILNTNDKNINAPNAQFKSSSSSTRTLNLGASIITVSNWIINDNTNFTINPGTSEIILNENGWIFEGGNMTYNNLTVNPLTWGGINFKGSNTFNTLTIEPGAEIIFEDGSTQSTTNFIATGNAGELITLKSSTNGVQAGINQTSHEFCGDYLNIKDMLATGAIFYAGEYSNDLGNNTGWTWSGVEANDQYPSAMCEDVQGGGTVAGIDLTALENAIDGGNVYTHTWYSDAALTTPVPVPANVTVSDAQIFYDEVDNGTCTNIAEVIYTIYPLPITSFVVTDVTCYGDNNGAVDLTVTNGTVPYTYLWSNSATTEDIFLLGGGTYIVTVNDTYGCQVIDSATVIEPDTLNVNIDSIYNVSCNGDTNGAVYTTTSGGTAPYAYLWTNTTQTTEDIIGLTADTYVVTVTDANACTAIDSATITEPTPLIITIDSVQNVSCNGGIDGAAYISVNGGTIPYTYVWTNTTQTTEDITGLTANTYNVTVTDANACTAIDSATITEPAPLTITTDSIYDVSCNGGSDGAVYISVSGGTGTYTYVWTNTTQTTEDITGLTSNTYYVTVTDANACTAIDSATITEPAPLTITIDSTHNVNCNGSSDGAVYTTTAGGTAPYTYSWTNTAQTTEDITGLTANTYNVTVTDANACTAIDSATITEPAPLTITIDSIYDVSCNGGTDGAVYTTTAGGTTPYTYVWTNTTQTTENITDLTANIYNVTITDANTCTAINSATINEPAPIVVTETITEPTCGNSDGQISVNVSGGTPPYTYLWSNAETTSSISGIGAGIYDLTVTDTNGCFTIENYLVNDQGAPLVSISSITDATCNGNCDGAINTDVSGGTIPYQFLWSNGETTQNIDSLCAGNYSLTVTDSLNCSAVALGAVNEPTPLSISLSSTNDDGTGTGTSSVVASGGTPGYSYLWDDPNAQITPTATGLFNGLYNVTVTDVNGCTISDTITVHLVTSIENIKHLAVIKIFPNPNNGNFTIKIDGQVNNTINVQIYNISGQKIYEDKINSKIKSIALPNIKEGVYFIKLFNDQINSIKKIIIK